MCSLVRYNYAAATTACFSDHGVSTTSSDFLIHREWEWNTKQNERKQGNERDLREKGKYLREKEGRIQLQKTPRGILEGKNEEIVAVTAKQDNCRH